jgi:protein disulfide-isomerase-like protein
MYRKIQNPETGNWVSTNDSEGKRILANYVQQMGGGDELVQSKNVTKLNKDTFSNFMSGSDLKLVGFFANWCGHCKSMQNDWSKASDHIAKQHHNKVKVAMVDSSMDMIDPNALSKQNGVKGFPSIKLFKNGSEVAEYEGNRTAKDMAEFVNKYA